METIFEAAELSLHVAFICTFITVPLALVLATMLYGSRWRPLEALLMLPLFLPPTVCGFFLLWLLSPLWPLGRSLEEAGLRVAFTAAGTVLACIVVSFPLAFQACMVGLSRIEPELKEGGRSLGGTTFYNTIRIVWPQMKSAILVAGLLVFARALGEFGASMMVGGNLPGKTQTLPLAVYTFAQSGQFYLAGVASVVSVLLGIVVFVVLRLLERHD